MYPNRTLLWEGFSELKPRSSFEIADSEARLYYAGNLLGIETDEHVGVLGIRIFLGTQPAANLSENICPVMFEGDSVDL